MAVGDETVSLPTPPPPRPAARRAAFDAALRKFDGSEEASREARSRKAASPSWWTNMRRRPAGALATAALVAVIGIPAAMVALRDQAIAPTTQQPVAAEPEPDALADSAPATAPVQAEPETETPATESSEPSRSSASEPLSLAPATRNAIPADELKRLGAPAPVIAPSAAAPPPPPPPPPPPAPQAAEEAGSMDTVVTGARIAQPQAQRKSENRERAVDAASGLAALDAKGEFLSRLQVAVRANDKRAVVRLVGLPLRVNFDAGPKTYSDRRSIERDFDLIFTPRVQQAILAQNADRLFTNYQGAMIGDGEVWFDRSCPNASCSPPGRMQINAINP